MKVGSVVLCVRVYITAAASVSLSEAQTKMKTGLAAEEAQNGKRFQN